MAELLHIIKLKIITPERVVYEDNITEISVPTQTGEITILPNHRPLVTMIQTGEIRIKKPDHNEIIPLAISSGVVEVRESSVKKQRVTEVIILATRSELASDIDVKRAEEAHARAVKIAKEKEFESDIDFAKFQALIDKEMNRIEVFRKWRK